MSGVIPAHADHGLSQDHIEHMRKVVSKQSKGFFIAITKLPEGCADLMSALYGPAAGDEPVGESDVTYEVRNKRPGPSRLVNRPERPCRRMVIVGIAGDEPVVFTAYGTQADSPSPREWWDSGMKPHETLVAAAFWTMHALASGTS
jgi:hypothetical protein